MMYSEFYERTKTEIPYDEYLIVEESYYDFPGNKDEFCKQWLQDVASGKWAIELSLRTEIAALRDRLKKQKEEYEENLSWYREQHEKQRNKINDLTAQHKKIKAVIFHACEELSK